MDSDVITTLGADLSAAARLHTAPVPSFLSFFLFFKAAVTTELSSLDKHKNFIV
jgi:hypothetical protein